MDDTQIKENVNRLKELKLQIGNLKKELNKLNRLKESWFNKKSNFNKDISERISGVKGSKEERNEITNKVQEFKKERDKLNKELNEKRNAYNKSKEAYDLKISKLKLEGNPQEYQKKISQMEYALQTNVMGFDKEQKLNKEIKLMKKQLDGFSAVKGEWEKIKTLLNEIKELRKNSNKVHKQIQTYASDSQDKHEVVIDKSKEIDDIKEKEEDAFKKFKEFKDKFTERNDELKRLVKEAEDLKKLLEESNVKIEEDKKEEQAKVIKEKAKEVTEKMKTGKKLTTEDLLIFQRSGKN